VADRKSPGEITPPVSLHPLRFDEAMKALMGVEPQRVGLGNKQLNINQSLKVKSPIPIKRLASVEVEPVVEV